VRPAGKAGRAEERDIPRLESNTECSRRSGHGCRFEGGRGTDAFALGHARRHHDSRAGRQLHLAFTCEDEKEARHVRHPVRRHSLVRLEQTPRLLVAHRLAIGGKRLQGNRARRASLVMSGFGRISDADDFQNGPVDPLHSCKRRFRDRALQNERAGIVRDAAHHVEPAGRAAQAHRAREVKRRAELRARARQQRRHRVQARQHLLGRRGWHDVTAGRRLPCEWDWWRRATGARARVRAAR
jgi:hypothetical protein